MPPPVIIPNPLVIPVELLETLAPITVGTSLSEAKANLKKRLHSKMFEKNVKVSQYNITVEDEKLRVQYDESQGNQSEQQNINRYSQLYKDMAEIIVEEVFKWIDASKKNIAVKVPHGTTATDLPSLIAAHSASPNLETQKFKIIVGSEETEPKGLKI